MPNILKHLDVTKQWQRNVSRGKRRIFPGAMSTNDDNKRNRGPDKAKAITHEGHFIAYAAEGQRFVIPLEYLNQPIIKELLQMAKNEFGLHTDGALMLPYEAALIEYILFLIEATIPIEIEKALIVFLCNFSSHSSSINSDISSRSRCLAPETLEQHSLCQKIVRGF